MGADGAASTGASYLEQAKNAVGLGSSETSGQPFVAQSYLGQAMAAVGLGAAAVAVEQERDCHNEKEAGRHLAGNLSSRASSGDVGSSGNILAGAVPERENNAVDGLGDASGTGSPSADTKDVGSDRIGGAKQTDEAPNVGGFGTSTLYPQTSPIQTTSNTIPTKAFAATSPATDVSMFSRRDQTSPIQTTTNTVSEKAPAATSPATDVSTMVPGRNEGTQPGNIQVDTGDHSRSGNVTSPTSPVKSTGHGRRASTGSGKVSLKDKIRGEIKVLSGKIFGNEGKVEAGRALKSGNHDGT